MNENLNLIEKLKNAPEGLELWSYACGTCYFLQIVKYTDYPIICKTVNKDGKVIIIGFTKDGRIDISYDNGKCVLFPSEQNHDWLTFVVPKDHKEFKPFEKVLRRTRDGNDNVIWTADFYSHYEESSMKHFLTSGYMANDSIIIPYEGNEDKLGKPVE